MSTLDRILFVLTFAAAAVVSLFDLFVWRPL